MLKSHRCLNMVLLLFKSCVLYLWLEVCFFAYITICVLEMFFLERVPLSHACVQCEPY